MQDKFLQFLSLCKRAGATVEGYNNAMQCVKKTKIYLCIISNDVSQNTLDKFSKICNDQEITMLQCYDKITLGRAVGRAEINVICLKDKNMSHRLMEIYESK
ncbi:ribosomal L7Ae/L30e/S12e/Gadd45 family protein [Clostridium oryzae]|uniref:Putative ribosomal protein YlxQ n=1 Tax=Clostridium oryzae TaxID=1450648 RepID=A0A1V4IPR1_9CLOT|nr:ribosomal L7Ae/L30e/S12e/Gadd45 family protein [Clostridium oryzae]OPJ61810.1 putative ribosomal protein YlxQ [Clostridium oryzae]